jgi:inorganic pyrophosphatase
MKIDAIIEIPRGSRNKYEFDPKANMIRLNRQIPLAVSYPADYGYIPNTLAEDGDPCDVLVLIEEPTFPGCLVEVKPLKILKMLDQGVPDHKILCAPAKSEYTMKDVPTKLLREIEHFFRVYKLLENKKIKIFGWEDKKAAKAYIEKSQKAFKK